MLEGVDKIAQGRIVGLVLARIRNFRQMQRQRAVRPEDAKPVLLDPRNNRVGGAEFGDIGADKVEMGALYDPDRIIGRLARFAQPRTISMRLLDPA